MGKRKVIPQSILVVVPQRPHDLTWQSIQAINWSQPFDILQLQGEDLAATLNRGRDVFLHGNYDAMLLVGPNMLIPPYALERLGKVKADVAYGLYSPGYRAWLAFSELGDDDTTSKAIGPEAWGTVMASAGVGLDCALIHRKALESITFTSEGVERSFARDLAAAGFTQAHDFGATCGAILSNGQVLCPTKEAPFHTTVSASQAMPLLMAQQAGEGAYRALTTITWLSSGETTQPGETVYLTAVQAADFLQREIVELCPVHEEGISE